MIHKIITHNGIFHADDVMATALLLEFIRPTIPVERTRNISADEFANPDVWIVDVGGQYNTELNNYDHHHDASLPSACVLVLKELCFRGHISTVVYDELIDPLMEISHIDCNGPVDRNGFQVNSLIKSFNAFPNGFDMAVQLCRNYILSCKVSAAKSVESRQIWDGGEQISLFIRACDEFPIHWKRYEEETFLVYPHDGKWNVLTINSEEFPLVSTGKETFMHANRFLGVFTTREDAISCAQASAYNAVG